MSDQKINVNHIKKFKGSLTSMVAITAYDALFAKIFDDYVDLILIGDSLNMSFNGKQDTISATMDMMLYHTKAVCRGSKRAFKVADMPFASYMNENDAMKNASIFFQESDVNAVKMEGGKEISNIIKKVCLQGMNVMGHIGLMPQQVRFEGGYKIKKDKEKLIDDAKALEDAGVFSIVLEGVQSDIAKSVENSVSVPVIGIGSGVNLNGQILVFSDLLGFFEDFKPKFVKQYLDGANLVRQAIKNYVDEVKNFKFPDEEHSYNG